MKVIKNEVFSLRNNELITTTMEEPNSGRYIAVMLRTVSLPGKMMEKTFDGRSVESLAVLAAEKVNNAWIWIQLSPGTKEIIGDLFFESNSPPDVWMYAIIKDGY